MTSNDEYEQDEVLCSALETYPRLSNKKRTQFLLNILKQADPDDMNYIYSTLPRLHRDFIRLLPPHIAHHIVALVHPRDICELATVCHSWRIVMKSPELWLLLYNNIGLRSMLNVYFNVKSPMIDNVKKYHLLGNWVKGTFKRRSIQAHQLGILAISLVDEKFVATGSADKTAKVFDLKSGILLRHFIGHDLPIGCLQLDEVKLITGSADATVKIWSLRDEQCHVTLANQHKKTVTALKFIGQVRYLFLTFKILISGSVDKSLKIWTLNERTQLPSSSPIVSTAFQMPASPVGGWTTAQTVRLQLQQNLIRNMERNIPSIARINPICVRTLHGHEGAIKALDFTPHILVSGDTMGFVKVWHVPSGNCLATIDMNTVVKGPMVFVKPQSSFSKPQSTSSRKESLDERPKVAAHDPISFICLRENRLALGKFSGTMYFYTINPYDPWLKLGGAGGGGSAASIQYENLKMWCEEKGTFSLLGVYELESGRVDKQVAEGPFIPASGNHTWALCVTMDAWRLMCGGSEGRCVLWNHREGRRIYTLKGDLILDGSKSVVVKQDVIAATPVDLMVEKKQGVSQTTPKDTLGRRKSFAPVATNMRRVSVRRGTESGISGTQIQQSAAAEEMKNKSSTGVAFDDRYIISGSMDGYLRIWDCVMTLPFDQRVTKSK